MFQREIFGLRVAELRSDKGLTQGSLGDALGVTKATISRIESADRAASPDLMVALADYFEVSLDYLVGRSDDPTMR